MLVFEPMRKPAVDGELGDRGSSGDFGQSLKSSPQLLLGDVLLAEELKLGSKFHGGGLVRSAGAFVSPDAVRPPESRAPIFCAGRFPNRGHRFDT